MGSPGVQFCWRPPETPSIVSMVSHPTFLEVTLGVLDSGALLQCQRGRETQAAKIGSCPHAGNSIVMAGELGAQEFGTPEM